MNIKHKKNGSTHLSGELPDLSVVYGLILQLRDAGIALLSLQWKEDREISYHEVITPAWPPAPGGRPSAACKILP